MNYLAKIKKGLQTIFLKLDVAGRLRAIVNKDTMKGFVFEETVSDTIKSLLTGLEAHHEKGTDTLTPRAIVFISHIEKGKWGGQKLKSLFEEIKAEMTAKLAEINGEKRATDLVNDIVKAWTQLLSKKDRYLYISKLYKYMLVPTFKTKSVCFPVPLFDSFIASNVIDYVTNYTLAMGAKEKDKRASYVKRAESELAKMKYTATEFLSSNKLHAFIEGLFKADFNVLAPFTHGSYKINEILVPVNSGFKIGDKVAGLRHPVLTGVVIFTVVGYTPDHTIKIDEIHFRRFQADSDGDFFLISDLIYYLISGKR